MNDGRWGDSILKTTVQPSPMSTTPAFSPGPWMTRGPLVGRRRRWMRDDLDEQCSENITEKTPSSVYVGGRPSARCTTENSSGDSLCDFASPSSTTGSPGRGRGETGMLPSRLEPRTAGAKRSHRNLFLEARSSV